MEPLPTTVSNRTTLIAVLLIATLALSRAAAGDGTLPGDARLARWIQAHPIPFAEPLTTFTNDYAAGRPLTAAGMAVALALLAARRFDAALLIALATALRATNGVLKSWVDSPRPTPDLVAVTERAASLGFPSGHAMGATLVLGAVAWIISARPLSGERSAPRFPPLPWRRGRPSFPPFTGGEGPGVRARAGSSAAIARLVVVAACLALILLTGYGRILVGAHWPSDVLGGHLWGGLLLLLALLVTGWVAERILGAGRPRPSSVPLPEQVPRRAQLAQQLVHPIGSPPASPRNPDEELR